MAKSVIVLWVVAVTVFVMLWSTGFAQARRHKKKPTPTATPTTGVRLQNPAQAPDPKSIE